MHHLRALRQKVDHSYRLQEKLPKLTIHEKRLIHSGSDMGKPRIIFEINAKFFVLNLYKNIG